MASNNYGIYSRRPAMLRAWERNAAAIDSAIKLYQAARRLEVATLKDGTKIVVRREDYGTYSVAGILR